MKSKKFIEEMDEYVLLKLNLDNYVPSKRSLPPGYKLVGSTIRSKIRRQERKWLQYYFADWDIPYCGKLPGWREDSPIYVMNGDELVAGVYLCDKNEFDEDPACGQLHYAFVAPRHRGLGIYSVVFREAIRRAQAWGLQSLYLNSDRHLLPEIYIKWGAVPLARIKKQKRLTSHLPSGLRQRLRWLIRILQNWWKTYIIPPC